MNPCQATTLDEVSDIAADAPSRGELPKSIRWLDRSEEDTNEHPWGPCDNETSFSLAEWFNNASNGKSLDDFDALLKVVKSDSFKLEDVKPLTARGLMKKLDDYTATSGIFSARDGWRNASVDIPLPKPGTKYASEADAPRFKVHGLHFRKLLEVLVGEVQDRRFASKRNWIPFETYWLPPADPAAPPGTPRVPPIRVFSDTFDTDEMNRLEAELKRRPRNPDDPPDLEYSILPVCIWSDATCLATFGSASLWPIYLYVANINKYIRGKPTEFVAQHLAYLPSVSCPRTPLPCAHDKFNIYARSTIAPRRPTGLLSGALQAGAVSGNLALVQVRADAADLAAAARHRLHGSLRARHRSGVW